MTTTTLIQLSAEDLREIAKEAVYEAMRLRDDLDRDRALDVVEYMTAPQAASIIGVSTTTFRKYVRDRRIPKRSGKSNERYHVDDILNFKKCRSK